MGAQAELHPGFGPADADVGGQGVRSLIQFDAGDEEAVGLVAFQNLFPVEIELACAVGVQRHQGPVGLGVEPDQGFGLLGGGGAKVAAQERFVIARLDRFTQPAAILQFAQAQHAVFRLAGIALAVFAHQVAGGAEIVQPLQLVQLQHERGPELRMGHGSALGPVGGAGKSLGRIQIKPGHALEIGRTHILITALNVNRERAVEMNRVGTMKAILGHPEGRVVQSPAEGG